MRHVALIVRNALRNRRRSSLNVISVAISICLLSILLALYYSFFLRPAAEGQALRLITIHRVSITNVMPVQYRDQIRQIPGVRDAMVLQWFGGEYKDPRDVSNMFARMTVEPEKLAKVYPEYRMPEEERRAFLADRRSCIVGRTLAQRHGFRIGDSIHIKGDIFPVNLDLVVKGVYDSVRDNENLFFHHEYLVQGVPWFQNLVSMIAVVVEPGHDLQKVAASIDQHFRNSTAETKTDTERAFEASFLSYLGDVKLFLVAVCLALTLTLLLVCTNTMAMSVRERVREIGVLKTLGFDEASILGMLAGESVILALVGAGIGLGLGQAVVLLLRTLPSIFVDLKPVAITAPLAGLCLLVAALVGLFASLFPAWGAARQPITQALRVVD